MPSEILPGLFLGQRPRRYDGFDVVVNCERSIGEGLLEDWSGAFLHVPMRDSEDFKIDEPVVYAAALLAAMASEAGRRVLIHCAAGRNRSGLVCGLAVRSVLGCTGDQAISLMREKRDLTTGRNGSPVLSNELFQAFVRR